MSSKSFNICVVLDILEVTCPGVWICPKGMVYLDIWLFGCNSRTDYVEPKFPLIFNEVHNFHESFTTITNLKEIQNSLEEIYTRITLVQVYKNKQVTLAIYNSKTDEILYPKSRNLNKNGETILLMKNEPLFPGTISPKITLVTKTSITEQINLFLNDDHNTSHNLETHYQPNRMKKVHHAKLKNSSKYFHHRIHLNEEGNTTSDSETNDHLYCQNTKQIYNTWDNGCHFKQLCKFCEDISRLKKTKCKKKISNQKNIKTLDLSHKSLDDDCKSSEIISNRFNKNIKATCKIGTHHYKCCKSKLNNRSSTNDSIKTSDDDSINKEKSIRKLENEKHEDSEEEPRKINPKIKARLHLDVYHCKCGIPNCKSSPSWRNICYEVNRKDTIGDTIKYHISLKNYYRQLYEGATYQLNRNLKLV